jgi:hypothetical protein
LVNLKQLVVSNNRLTSLPSAICDGLVNLKELFVSNNQLTSLPSEIGKLVNLEQLDVRGNPIKIPVSLHYKLKKVLIFDGFTEIIGGVKDLHFSEDGPFAQDFRLYGNKYDKTQNVSEKGKEVLKSYTYKYDAAINSSLRRNEASEFVYEAINSIIDVVRKVSPLPPVLLYRGISPF